MSSDMAQLFALLRQVCPATVLCTAMVPLASLSVAAGNDPNIDTMAIVDYVLFDSETGAVLGAILLQSEDEVSTVSAGVAHQLAVLGVRSITVSRTPDRQALSAAVKSFT